MLPKGSMTIAGWSEEAATETVTLASEVAFNVPERPATGKVE